MNRAPGFPPADELTQIVPEPAHDAFAAGWRAGTHRHATKPASQDVLEQIAAMLDAAITPTPSSDWNDQ
jgi:hypothetical protein